MIAGAESRRLASCGQALLGRGSAPTHLRSTGRFSEEGSNDGEWYRARNRAEYFGKVGAGQASAEVIASLTYRFFGYETADTYRQVSAGEVRVFSREVKNVKGYADFTTMNSAPFRRLRFAATFLADTDRWKPANNLLRKDGRVVLIDFGGTLGFTATGLTKNDEPSVSEEIGSFSGALSMDEIYDSFIGSTPDRHPWSNVTVKDARDFVKRLQEFSDEIITDIVKAAAYSDPNDERYMIQALIQRRDVMIQGLVQKVAKQLAAREVPPKISVKSFRLRKQVLDKHASYSHVDMKKDTDIILFLTPESLLEAARAGFKNYFQSGKISGDQNIGYRVKSEQRFFGIIQEHPGEFRPIYAILNVRAKVNLGERARPWTVVRDFGAVSVVFNDDVKSHSTWNYGDSQMLAKENMIFEEIGAAPQDLIGDFQDPAIARIKTPYDTLGRELYFEAQIHRRKSGGLLNAKDINYLMVDEFTDVEPLKVLGKPIFLRTEKSIYGRTVFFPGQQLYTPTVVRSARSK